ncbi:MAG: DUF721 domain-containing protein [Candidatus Cyclobacteriaceae bacterium M3_2C_046]
MHHKSKPNSFTRKSDTSPLSDVIKDLLNAYKIDKKFNQVHIINSWEKVMGKTIAKRTTKIFFKDRVMFLELNSAPLKQELSLKKSKLIKLLQDEFGQELVEDVIIM